jgi:hypothetical protein
MGSPYENNIIKSIITYFVPIIFIKLDYHHYLSMCEYGGDGIRTHDHLRVRQVS